MVLVGDTLILVDHDRWRPARRFATALGNKSGNKQHA